MGVRREGITFVDDVGGGGGGVDVNVTGPIGQKPMAASVSVTIASDQTPVPVTIGGAPLSTSHIFTFNNEAFDIDVTTFGSLAIYQATALGGFDGKVFMQGSTDGITFFGVFAVRADDGQPIDFINQSSTNFPIRINVSGLNKFRLFNTNWTIGSSKFLISGSSQVIENSGVNIYDKSTQNHLAIDGGGRIKNNFDQIGGVTPDTNIGAASNGTQRVVLANNQPTVPISAASLPLPTGASTAGNQATEIASLTSIDSKLTNPIPVTVASLPLPAGAATSANQTTEISSLSSIDSKLTGVATSTLQTTLEQDLIQNLNEHNVLLRAILLQLNYIGLQLNAPVVPAEMVDIAMVH